VLPPAFGRRAGRPGDKEKDHSSRQVSAGTIGGSILARIKTERGANKGGGGKLKSENTTKERKEREEVKNADLLSGGGRIGRPIISRKKRGKKS